MKINRVTITGADNNTDINEMVEISKQYPLVEWGILFSPKRIGEERYPDLKWVSELVKKFYLYPMLTLSAHLCGGYTREMLVGKNDLSENTLKDILPVFMRRQLNFNATKNPVDLLAFLTLLERQPKEEFILQQNKSNSSICKQVRIHQYQKSVKNVAFLYDSSGGRGTVASQWDEPFVEFFTGYAGGLSPENLEDELKKIEQAAGDAEIWIDTESRVRTNGILDLNKVRRFLDIVSNFKSKK